MSHVCLPAIIDSDPGSDPNIMTSILYCNLLGILSTGRHCAGTAPTCLYPFPTPVDQSTSIADSISSGGCSVLFGWDLAELVSFVSINDWIKDLTIIHFGFFAVYWYWEVWEQSSPHD
jgi:hypothetical protein